MNPNYDPNTLNRDQARARRRKRVYIGLSTAFFVLIVAAGLGIGIWRFLDKRDQNFDGYRSTARADPWVKQL